MALLIVTAAWRFGLRDAGAEIIVVAITLLSHLTWGNIVSVIAPFRMPFYRMSSGAAPLTALAGMTLGSIPAVVVLFLLDQESASSAPGIAVILFLVIAAYLVSLHHSGRRFEHRRHIIAERLS